MSGTFRLLSQKAVRPLAALLTDAAPSFGDSVSSGSHDTRVPHRTAGRVKAAAPSDVLLWTGAAQSPGTSEGLCYSGRILAL